MATSDTPAPEKSKGFRIYPSPYVMTQLNELAHKGQLAQTVPEVARILLGERLMQLEQQGLVQTGTRKQK